MVDSSLIYKRASEEVSYKVDSLKALISLKKEQINETVKELAELYHSGEWAEMSEAAFFLQELEAEVANLEEKLEDLQEALRTRKIVLST